MADELVKDDAMLRDGIEGTTDELTNLRNTIEERRLKETEGEERREEERANDRVRLPVRRKDRDEDKDEEKDEDWD